MSKAEESSILKTFKEWDARGTATIRKEKLRLVLLRVGVTEADVDKVLSHAGSANGRVDYANFVSFLFSASALEKDALMARHAEQSTLTPEVPEDAAPARSSAECEAPPAPPDLPKPCLEEEEDEEAWMKRCAEPPEVVEPAVQCEQTEPAPPPPPDLPKPSLEEEEEDVWMKKSAEPAAQPPEAIRLQTQAIQRLSQDSRFKKVARFMQPRPCETSLEEASSKWSESLIAADEIAPAQQLIDMVGIRRVCEERASRSFSRWEALDFRWRARAEHGVLVNEYQIHVAISDVEHTGSCSKEEVAELTLKVEDAKDQSPLIVSFICTGAAEGSYPCLSMYYVKQCSMDQSRMDLSSMIDS